MFGNLIIVIPPHVYQIADSFANDVLEVISPISDRDDGYPQHQSPRPGPQQHLICNYFDSLCAKPCYLSSYNMYILDR